MFGKGWLSWLLALCLLLVACRKEDIGNRTQELIARANALVQNPYPAAILLEVHGLISGSAGFSAQDVIEYEFIYSLVEKTVVLHWRDGDFSSPELVDKIWLGSFPLPLPLLLSLTDAIDKMRAAGYASPFTTVTIRQPVCGTVYSEGFYIFAIADHPFVFVGSRSGVVFTS